MPYWDEDPYKIVTHLPLSSDIVSIMYTDIDVLDKLAQGEDPIQISIDKWERILQVYTIISELKHPYAHYDEIINFIGYKTCALCIVSIRKFEELHDEQKFKEDKCSVCPLSKIERCIDESSTFSKIEKLLNYKFNFGDDLAKSDFYLQEHKHLGQLIGSFIDVLKKLK